MAKTFRLTDKEEELLYKVSLTINRELVKLGKYPIRDSQILHEILEQTLLLGEIEVTREGEIRVISKKTP